jgi:hypothetical protein
MKLGGNRCATVLGFRRHLATVARQLRGDVRNRFWLWVFGATTLLLAAMQQGKRHLCVDAQLRQPVEVILKVSRARHIGLMLE